MIKKANWLENVKKAFSPDVKKLKHQSFEETEISYPVLVTRSRSSPPQFEVRVDEVNYEHKKKKNLSHPPSEAEEEDDPLVDSTTSSPEFVPPPAKPDRFAGKSKEEAAAILIQSTFRGHLARVQESKRMRRLARLKLLMEGSVVKRQAAHTLKSIHAFSRVQSQIWSRKIRMSKENQTRHKQLLQKHTKDIGGSKNGGGNRKLSNQSKKQVEAGLLNKCEATVRKERALANASTHQQHLKSNLKPTNTMFMDPNNLTWGWSWSERWTADRPGENSDKEESSTVKTSTNRNSNGGKSSNHKRLSNSTQPNTPSASPSTTRNPKKNKPNPPSVRPKTTEESPKNSVTNPSHSIARSSVSDDEGLARRRNMIPTKPSDEISKNSEKNRRHNIIARSSVSDDEGLTSSTARFRNVVLIKPPGEIAKSSEKNLRHSVARSSVSDDEGLSSSVARRRNMVPAKPPRGNLKAQSSSAATKTRTEESNDVLQEKAPAKKRASPAPKPRRSSATAKVENSVLKAVKTPTPCA